jgi:predicted RNA-binding protein YlqC (UPF0109 family)
MQGLVDYMVRSMVKHPDAIVITAVEGEASVLVRLDVHEDDRALLLAEDADLMAAMRQILGAAGGQRKAVLELVDPANDAGEE